MVRKFRKLYNLLCAVQGGKLSPVGGGLSPVGGKLSPAVKEVLLREEENGTRTMLIFRVFFFILFLLGGLTASPSLKDTFSNFIFASLYGVAIFLQGLLLYKKKARALRRFNYFLVLADYILFAALNIFYFIHYSPDNFNHVLKSPYMILFLIPILSTLVQFRLTLLFFSLAIQLTVVFALWGYAHLSHAPTTTVWKEYILGNAIIYPAWLGVWILFPLAIASLLGYAIFRSIRMISEIGKTEGERKELARYFSPAVVDAIIQKDSTLPQLKDGKRHQIAVLFADIRSFTTLSEKMPVTEIAQMLSELRQFQIEAVFQNDGMVDKFMGDAIMAVFGAPHSSGSFTLDVQNAVRAGLSMHSSLVKFNAAREAKGEIPIRFGIGIHAGEAFVGNLGGAGQLEYTVIGDAVNTASRIEHLCKKAQADFLVSETVALHLTHPMETQKIGRVKIRGREELMTIYKVIH
ncbi:MAG: hypothetical protein LDLANPLL_02331 [Turneriella sp.]|nr:hypothetical protein [Turneriella sp.]